MKLYWDVFFVCCLSLCNCGSAAVMLFSISYVYDFAETDGAGTEMVQVIPLRRTLASSP